LENAIKKLSNKKIIILVDVPELPFHPKDCLRILQSCSILKIDVEKRQEEIRKILLSLKEKYPKISIFDPLDFICEKDKCSYKNKDQVFYSDDHHLSLEGSDAYGEHFKKIIQ
jgi:hypothetical protein